MMKFTTSKGVPLVEKFQADDASFLTRERQRVMETAGKCRRFWEANVHDRGDKYADSFEELFTL